MKTRSSLWITITGCCGLFLSTMIFFGCKIQSGNISAAMSDSTKSFTAIVTSAKYADNLTRVEYKGRSVYNQYCRVCHGEDGDGKGFNAYNLKNSFGVQPADFTDSTFMVNHTMETITNVVAKGGKRVNKSQYMPPWGETLNREEIENVVTYIKMFSRLKALGDLSK
jgi:mono/diheme cytochrome c family protein